MKRIVIIFVILLSMQSYSNWQDKNWSRIFNRPIRSSGATNTNDNGTLKYDWRLVAPLGYDTTAVGPLFKHAAYVATRESDSEKIRDSVIIYNDRPVFWWRFNEEYRYSSGVWDTSITSYHQEFNDSLVEYLWDLLEDTDSLPIVKKITRYSGGLPVSKVDYEVDEYEYIDSAWTFKMYADDSIVYYYNSNELLDSTVRFRFEEDSGSWFKTACNKYSWSDDKKNTSNVYGWWDNGSWDTTYSILYSYNSAGNCSTYMTIGDSIQYKYKYDDKNRQIEGYTTYPFRIFYIDSIVQVEQKMSATWSATGDTMISLTFFNESGNPTNAYLVDSTHKVWDASGNIVSKYEKKIGWRWEEELGDTTINFVIGEAGISQDLWEYKYNADSKPVERVKKTYRGDTWQIDTTETITWLPNVSISSIGGKKHSNISVKALHNGLSVKFTTLHQSAKFRITDLKGRVVDAAKISAGAIKNGWQWKADNLASGMYLYRISYKDRTVNGKVLIRR